MRVMHVISALDARAGGTTSALVTLATSQTQAGIDVTVASTFSAQDDTSPTDAIRAAGAQVELIGPTRGKLRRHPELGARVRKLVTNSDLVHVHAVWEEIQHVAAREARAMNRPYLFTPHGMLDPWSLSQRKWVKRICLAWRLRRDLNAAAAIHFTSKIECDLVTRLNLKPPAIVVPNALDLSEFVELPPRGSFRSRFEQIGDRRIVLFMSRLHPKKGLDLLIPAFARARSKGAVLVIAGPSSMDYQAQLQRMVEQHQLIDRVIFTGMLRGQDRVAALADADLFVLPSHQENFGIVVAEALAAGCAVLISNQVNIYREIQSAGVGAVFRLDIGEIANELSRWMGDDTMRAIAAAKGPAWVRQHFDHHVIARRWLNEYQHILSHHCRPPG